ncbi:MAG: HlyD family efflux transporter periplasmic adaptor subunit [Byssovorax sp.]
MWLSAALLGLALAGCRAGAQGPEPFQGVVELDERAIGFEVPGRVRDLKVKRGETLRAGAPIGALDDTLARPAFEARQAEVKAAEAQLALLKAGSRAEDIRATTVQLSAARDVEAVVKRNLDRQRELVKQGALGAATTDDLEAQLARAEGERKALEQKLSAQRSGARSQEIDAATARLAASRAALAAEEQRLARFSLAAPDDGVVLDLHVETGEVVAAGSPVITLGDVAHPYVDVFVPQASLSGIKVGERASVRVDAEQDAFSGVVEDIGRKTEFTPRYLFSPRERPNLVVRVRVRVDDPGARLHAGVPAFVTLTGEAAPARSAAAVVIR